MFQSLLIVFQILENDAFTLGIFIDFSKAFDKVDHIILLNSLNQYGINNKYYDWEVRNSQVTKSSYKTELRKMTAHFELLTRNFLQKFFF